MDGRDQQGRFCRSQRQHPPCGGRAGPNLSASLQPRFQMNQFNSSKSKFQSATAGWNTVRPGRSHQSRGMALVIVLSFIVLLTGLVVAFFSRSIVSRQMSNAGVGKVKASLLAQGAM